MNNRMNEKIERDSKGVHDPTRINEIPPSWFERVDSILDLGSNDGLTLLKSEYASFFGRLDREDKYLGIDVIRFQTTHLRNIIRDNILRFDTERRFDCVLCIHSLEHIPIELWPNLIKKMKKWLNPNGCLIIGVPYNELDRNYVSEHEHESQAHVVFEINERTFRPFLSDITKIVITDNRFNGDGSGLLWSHFRWIKRVLTRHPYRKSSGRLLMLWRKTR